MRVAAAVAWKLLLAGAVVVAGPLSHLWWGEEYRGQGMNQWDALLAVVFVSVVLAGLLLATFAATGWLLSRRLGWQAAVDLALFGVAFGLGVGAGVTTRVVDAERGATDVTITTEVASDRPLGDKRQMATSDNRSEQLSCR
jgi:hypothetical protein